MTWGSTSWTQLDTGKNKTCNSQFWFTCRSGPTSLNTLDRVALALFTQYTIKLEGKSGTPCPTESCRTIRSNAIWPKKSVSQESCNCKELIQEKVAILTAETCMDCDSPVLFTLAREKKKHMTWGACGFTCFGIKFKHTSCHNEVHFWLFVDIGCAFGCQRMRSLHFRFRRHTALNTGQRSNYLDAIWSRLFVYAASQKDGQSSCKSTPTHGGAAVTMKGTT